MSPGSWGSSPHAPGSTGSVTSRGHAAQEQFTFKPVITKRGAAQKPRPVEDMSEGERLRREANLVRP
jgi:hypothetical protein